MQITKKVLDKTTLDAVGQDALPVVKYLKNRDEVSEFEIAEETEIEIHDVRNILYRLNNLHLATYIRKKDTKKGWYISYWTLNKRRFRDLSGKLRKNKLAKLKNKLQKEEKHREGLYICPNLCTRKSFGDAMDQNFQCQECGERLEPQDNSRTIEHLKTMIQELEASA